MINIFRTFCLTLSIIGISADAFGQRGAMRPGSPSSFTTPNQGYPGFFDTNMVDHGSVVVEWPPIILPIIPMPSIALDYGVSDTLTVGTNALISTVPWMLGAKGFSIKARTLVYGTETMQSVATVYGGYIGATEFASSWELVTSNTAWKLAPRHVISGQLMFMNFGAEVGKETSAEYTNLRLSSAAAGAGYQFLLTEETAISSYLLGALSTSVESDTVAANLSADLNVTSGDALWGIARISADIKTGDWLYSLGGVYIHGLGGNILPWFSATRRW